MLNIYIARHGQDTDNILGILNGRRDGLLTEIGIKQAHEVADKIRKARICFDSVYCSPLRRTQETAKIISEVTGSATPEVEPLLIERDFGIMTGKKIADIERLCAPNILKAEIITYFLSPEGAETFPELMKRGRALLDKIQNRHNSGNILLVTHGDIGKMIYAEYYHLDWRQILMQFHFGNGELLIMSKHSAAEDPHVFKIDQHNH